MPSLGVNQVFKLVISDRTCELKIFLKFMSHLICESLGLSNTVVIQLVNIPARNVLSASAGINCIITQEYIASAHQDR